MRFDAHAKLNRRAEEKKCHNFVVNRSQRRSKRSKSECRRKPIISTGKQLASPPKEAGAANIIAVAFGFILWVSVMLCADFYPLVRSRRPEVPADWLFPALLITVLLVGISPPLLHYVLRSETTNKPKASAILTGILLAGIVAWLSVGSILTIINGAFDQSVEQTHNATVISKYISSGRSKSYFLVFPDWDKRAVLRDVHVTRDFYERKPVKSSILITTKAGALGQEWIARIE